MHITELETDRLFLRQWRESDFPAFAELNSDTEAMKYFPATLTREESDDTARRCMSLISTRGWGFWATELKATQEFIGFVGLHEPNANLPFSPCVEIGWRLLPQYWGNGYATEAATEALSFSFQDLKLDEVLSFTTVSNFRSRSVMERLGLTNTQQNFPHPNIPPEHSLSEHVLYKITQVQWQERNLL